MQAAQNAMMCPGLPLFHPPSLYSFPQFVSFDIPTHTHLLLVHSGRATLCSHAKFATVHPSWWLVGDAGSIRLAAVYSGFSGDRAAPGVPQKSQKPQRPQRSPKEPLKAAGRLAVVSAATDAWPMAAGQRPPSARGDATPETPGSDPWAGFAPWTGGPFAGVAPSWVGHLAAAPSGSFGSQLYKNLEPASPLHRGRDQCHVTALVASRSFLLARSVVQLT